MEVKLARQLAYIEQVLLYFFVDIRKSFDVMDHKRCMQILKD